MYKYFQLLDSNYGDLADGDDNPANISDGTDGRTAAKIAREYMRANGIATAILVINAVMDDGGDNILSVRELNVNL